MDNTNSNHTLGDRTWDMGEFHQLLAFNLTQEDWEKFASDSNFVWLLISLLTGMAWFTYITFYHSRLFGQILTQALNKFIGHGYIHIGSISWNAIAGKVMFRDVAFITEDFSLRFQDGWLIFRWWRSYVPKDISEDLSHSDTRLSILLNGLELHVYNRSELYSQLEKLFGLDPSIIRYPGSTTYEPTKDKIEGLLDDELTDQSNDKKDDKQSWLWGRAWRDLIPVIKVDLCCSRVVFGNRLVPTTLSLTAEELHFMYSTKAAVSRLDHFMHIVKGQAENFKVLLSPSPKYVGSLDEPPRFMGEGFVILSSNNVECYYYMDEPGLVPETPEMVVLANGDVVEANPPIWGIDIKCGKGTDFSYGPWADRQREQLFKFFFPQSYQNQQVTPPPRTGEKRAVQSFDIRLSTLGEATIDILFSKNKETNAVHINVGAGSYLEVTIPWVVTSEGCTNKITGQLLHLDASTSLQYRSLIEAETLEYSVAVRYPLAWNSHQEWSVNFTGCKATAHIIYEHRFFFQDMLEDWGSRTPADLLHFIPYTCHLGLILKEFEIVTVVNEYNWIDCSSQNQENMYAAFSGDLFDLSFDLPFDEFLPPTILVKFWIQGEVVDMSVFLPNVSSSRSTLLALQAESRILGRDGSTYPVSQVGNKKWRNFAQLSDGWVVCITVPIVALSIDFTYHPIYGSGPKPQAGIPTPEKEERMLTPFRLPGTRQSTSTKKVPNDSFDLTSLADDTVVVELEVGPSEIYLYGVVLKVLLALKENIFGEDQRFVDMDPCQTSVDAQHSTVRSVEEFFQVSTQEEQEMDPRWYRPLKVIVTVTMHDIQAHLLKHCGAEDPPCPTLTLERFGFEMHKTFMETRLQLVLSPLLYKCQDTVSRLDEDLALKNGFALLSGLQFRGHAMFSHEGRLPEEETLEYGWLMELIVGQFSGRLTLPQIQQTMALLDAFMVLAEDSPNQFSSPKPVPPCHHGAPQASCVISSSQAPCPQAEYLKYKMTRILFDGMELNVVEAGTALLLKVYPSKAAFCNLHGPHGHAGLSAFVERLSLRHFLRLETPSNRTLRPDGQYVPQVDDNDHTLSTAGTSRATSPREYQNLGKDSGKLPKKPRTIQPPSTWLEIGALDVDHLVLDVALSDDPQHADLHQLQHSWLQKYDKKTKRLWFLWSDQEPRETDPKPISCGCLGSCAFFGRNENGRLFLSKPALKSKPNAVSQFATFRVANPGEDPGYGQSILHEQRLLFDVFASQVRPLPTSPDNGARSGQHYSTHPSCSSNNSYSRPSSSSTLEERFLLSNAVSTGDASNGTETGHSIIVHPLPYPGSHHSSFSMEEECHHDFSDDVPLLPKDREEIQRSSSLTEAVQTRSSPHKFKLGLISKKAAQSTPLLTLASSTTNRKSSRASLPDLMSTSPKKTFSRLSSQASYGMSESFYSAAEEDEEEEEGDTFLTASKGGGSTNRLVETNVLAAAVDKVLQRSPSEALWPENDTISQNSLESGDSTLAPSPSSISFASAVSSPPDFSLVDLHAQTHRPISESPLLMASYSRCLSRASCQRWSTSPSYPAHIFYEPSPGPQFQIISEGFTAFRLTDQETPNTSANCASASSFSKAVPPSFGKAWDGSYPARSQTANEENDNEIRFTYPALPGASNIVVKLDGPVHIMLCPLSLESIQSMLEALTPSLENLHPLTVVTRLQQQCVNFVLQRNPLLRSKSAELSAKVKGDVQQPQSVIEQTYAEHWRLSCSLPNIHLCFLQVGIVEEVISFSALDHPRDLLCVALLAFSMQDLLIQAEGEKTSHHVVHAAKAPPEVGPAKGKRQSTTSKALGPSHETLFVESSSNRGEQSLVSAKLGCLHVQLRRLWDDNVFPADAIITAIPVVCSKVGFRLKPAVGLVPEIKTPSTGRSSSRSGVEPQDRSHRLKVQRSTSSTASPVFFPPLDAMDKNSQLGIIMFECGIEHVHINLVKKTAGMDVLNNDVLHNHTHCEEYERGDRHSRSATDARLSTPAGCSQTGEPCSTSSNLGDNKESKRDSNHGKFPNWAKKEDQASVALQVKTFWFSFAAPPRSPITKRIDYTRLDWNLLSTATPAIRAWLSAGDRLYITVKHTVGAAKTRSLAVVAALMAEGLEAQQLHLPVKRRYACLSPFAQSLQQDPSCQLTFLLHKLVLESDKHLLAESLQRSTLPPLSLLQQGVVVLSRQWKNTLYTPILLDTMAAKPSAMPPRAHTDSNANGSPLIDHTVLFHSRKASSGAIGSQDSLLGSMHALPPYSGAFVPPPQRPPSLSNVSPSGRYKQWPGSPSADSSSDRMTLSNLTLQPTLSSPSAAVAAATTANAASGVLHSEVGISSPDGPAGNKKGEAAGEEDLYSWMVRQQESAKKEEAEKKASVSLEVPEATNKSSPWRTTWQTLRSSPLTDVYVIFAPLLTSLNVASKKEVMRHTDDWAGDWLSQSNTASVLASVDELRVEIFESEQAHVGKKGKVGARPGQPGKFLLYIPPEVPAFLCEKIALELDVRKVPTAMSSGPAMPLRVESGMKKIKTTTMLNFSISVGYIAQQVNMPLLRLLHQITSVYINVKETQSQLREHRPDMKTMTRIPSMSNSLDGFSKDEVGSASTDCRMSSTPGEFNIQPHSGSIMSRLRNSTRLKRGYTGLKMASSPLSVPGSRELRSPTSPSPASVLSHKHEIRCWKTVAYLVDLYASMPDSKVVLASAKEGLAHGVHGPRFRPDYRGSFLPSMDAVDGDGSKHVGCVVIFGVACINKVRLLAMLSGLRLEAEISAIQSSFSYKEASHVTAENNAIESSLTGHVGRAMIVLLEGIAPSQQTVVKVTVGKSQALYSTITDALKKQHNSGLVTVGAVLVDIPQHPVVLHGMMTRGTKQLSSTLQEFRVPRFSSRASRATALDVDVDNGPLGTQSPKSMHDGYASKPVLTKPSNKLLEPLVMQFSIILQSLSVTAALLPSLQAQYHMEQVVSTGITGNKAGFSVDLAKHSLSFTTKLQVSEANLPPSACIDLPEVHVTAEYKQDGMTPEGVQFFDDVVLCRGSFLNAAAEIGVFEHCLTTDLLNHLVFVQKVFMKEVNEVLLKVSGGDKPVPLWEEQEPSSSLSHRLLYNLTIKLKGIQITATTPTNTAVRLETGLVELQLSNRVQKASDSKSCSDFLRNMQTKLFGRANLDINLSLGQLIRNPLFEEAEPEYQQAAFFKTRIGLRNAFHEEVLSNGSSSEGDKELVLITLNRPLVFLQPVAVDKAILVWLNYKNAYDYWTEQRTNLGKETYTLQPDVLEKLTTQLAPPNLGTLFLQLTVDDMGICLPLHSCPPAWAGGRLVTDSEGCGAVVVTLEHSSISACSSGSLVSKGRFTGLCLRFADDFETGLDDWKPDMTDSSLMNSCVVSEGTYEVCSRTVAQNGIENAKWILNVGWQMEGVDTHLDTSIGKQLSALGHTLTMLTGGEEEGTITATGHTSEDSEDEEEEGQASRQGSEAASDVPDGAGEIHGVEIRKNGRSQVKRGWSLARRTAPAGTLLQSSLIDSKWRTRVIEKEMTEQARIIHDLRALGASAATVEQEMKRLQELEALAFKGFRRDMIQRLRRQSVKTSSLSVKENAAGLAKENVPSAVLLEDVFGSGAIPILPNRGQAGHQRSKSIAIPSTVDSSHEVLTNSLPSHAIPAKTPESKSISSKMRHSSGTNVSTATKTTPNAVPIAKPQEPNVDLELDVKVRINSGKCVLHTRDSREEELKNRMRKERSFSSGLLNSSHQNSPNTSRRKTDLRFNVSSSRLKGMGGVTSSQLADLTIFHIPGLDVKVHYDSRMVAEDSKTASQEPLSSKGKNVTKKASLFTWMTLQSIPEETIVSPHILQFLEQALEPISNATANTNPVLSVPKSSSTDNAPLGSVFTMDFPASGTATQGPQSYGSFPVDVVVYFHMQPSVFRFSCLPVSRVECLLRLPSLHLVFSSKRAEDPLQSEFVGQKEAEFFSNQGPFNLASAVGGLSVTGCLSDFSLYIFHPYGGGKKSGGGSTARQDEESERKDSLSVNVEFVKFIISRFRKLHLVKRSEAVGQETSKAVIRFSTIVDIGSASFKYDMRRLTEILAFPKAWYRRSIVRRLFLGDFTRSYEPSAEQSGARTTSRRMDTVDLDMNSSFAGSFDAPENGEKNVPHESSTPTAVALTSWETLVVFAVNFTKLNVHMNMGNVMGNVTWLTKDFKSEGRLSIGSSGHKNMYIGVGLQGSSLDAKGGIVGGAIELSGIETFLRIQEDPGTEPDHRVGLKLYALECRLDYMGTSVLMGRVSGLDVIMRDEWKVEQGLKTANKEPLKRKNSTSSLPTRRPAMIFIHGTLGWDQLQMMMSKSTTADLLKMYLKLDEFFQQQFRSSKRLFSSLEPPPTSASLKRRKMAVVAPPTKVTEAKAQSTQSDVQHHRHWQKAICRVAGVQISTLPELLPEFGTIVGGTMELHGTNISLACFHGINFKTKSWALFSLKEPCISFATEAQQVPGNDPSSIHVVQNLSFSLGIATIGSRGIQPLDLQPNQHSPASMATVCRISRDQLFPPQFRTLQDWFLYAFATSRLDAVERFPSLERERERCDNQAQERKGPMAHAKVPNYHHATEIIFAFPSLQLHVKSEHFQTGISPDPTGEKAMVECSFITDFEDHIFVTMDAEGFFFLHDLISSYVKEKERVVSASSHIGRTQSPDILKVPVSLTKNGSEGATNNGEHSGSKMSEGASASNLTEDDGKRKLFDLRDWRNFECKTWHLEPTVRLLSWAGKRIEPYGVDYILNKLGFSQARVTIPKWVQRGAMDPMDKLLSVLLDRTVAALKASEPATIKR